MEKDWTVFKIQLNEIIEKFDERLSLLSTLLENVTN